MTANACRITRLGIAAGLVVLAATRPAPAQEMEPRAYSPSPIGMNFFSVVAGSSSGAVLFDPTLPITDVSASLAQASVGYARTFALFGRQALVAAGLPYVRGHFEGLVLEQARRVERQGFADLRLRMSLQLLGPGVWTPGEFAKAPRRTVVAMSLTVQAPAGEYDETKLINLGTNRWSFKPEVGVSVPVGRWYLDAYAGVWLFTDNDRFFPGSALREQNPLTALQAHASYQFRSRAWLAIDGTWYGGGSATVDDGPPSTRQNNTRVGGTFSMPVTRTQSVKIAASTGAAARAGTNFDSYLVGWQIAWFDKPRQD